MTVLMARIFLTLLTGFPMSEQRERLLGVACSTGGFKGVFVHGVLSALESARLRVGAYAAASSSVFPAVCAAIGQAEEVGLRYWRAALHTLSQPGNGMSEVVLQSIADSRHLLHQNLFQPDAARLLIATSKVVTDEGAAQTQGEGARRLGRKLLIAAARHDRSWADANLLPYLFDTAAPDDEHRITPDTIDAVIYASTRMLHAWTRPAEIDGQPFIDASYTCACPALALAERGYQPVIAIGSEPGPLYTDMFQTTSIPDEWNGVPIYSITPERDPATLGADFTTVTEAGLVQAYEDGKRAAEIFLRSHAL